MNWIWFEDIFGFNLDSNLHPEVRRLFDSYSKIGCSIYGFDGKSSRRSVLFGVAVVIRLVVFTYFLYDIFTFSSFEDLIESFNDAKPITILVFNSTFIFFDLNIVLIIGCLTIYRKQLLVLFAHPLYQHHLSNQTFPISCWKYLYRLLTIVIFSLLSYYSTEGLCWIIVDVLQTTGYIMNFLFLYEIYMLVFRMTIRIVDIQLINLQSIQGNLSKTKAYNVMRIVRQAGDNLTMFNSILSIPIGSIMVSAISVSIGAVSSLFLPFSSQLKALMFMNLSIMIYSVFVISHYSHRCLCKFDELHEMLLDHSIDTIERSRLRWQCEPHDRKSTTDVSFVNLYDSISILEFRIYRHQFKTFCLGSLFPVNLRTFAFICGFILNYSVLLVQTSILI